MKKLEVGFFGLHHCGALKRYCDSVLIRSHRSAKKLRAGSELGELEGASAS